jgi:hypothetical protein
MKPSQNRHRLLLVILGLVMVTLACGGYESGAPAYRPWAIQPLRLETKEYFCTKFSLPSTHPVCQPERDVFAKDLIPIVEQRFPVNTTSYSEVAKTLDGYPVAVEGSKSPDGIVSSRTYVYSLTEFDGFCVYFVMNDVQSEMVERVLWSENTKCVPDVDGQPASRPWLLKPKNQTKTP